MRKQTAAPTGFDTNFFINSLMEEMGMQSEPQDVRNELEEAIEKQMTHIILNTASLYIEPETIDMVLADYRNETDPVYFIRQLIAYSPEAQAAILQALDAFYTQTLEAYNTLKK